jgi:hypothetical protein
VKDLAELRQLSAREKVAFFGLNYRAFAGFRRKLSHDLMRTDAEPASGFTLRCYNKRLRS